VSKGVSEIDIRSPRISRNVTDAAQVQHIVDWFHYLRRPSITSIECRASSAANVTFTFR
jgi:hypothetical protein